MEYMFEGEMEGIGILIFWVLYLVGAFAMSIAGYVLRALGVYTIAKRRGIRNPWFAWLPVVDYFLLGCVSDQYQYVVKGKVRNKRKVLLGLGIAMTVITAVFFGGYIAIVVQGVRALMDGVSEYAMMESLMGPIAAIGGLSMPMMILSIVTAVFRYIALYDLYTSCSPQNNVLFLVLSIVFSVTEPFFIFFIRMKDGGMPPRKSEVKAQAAPAIAETTRNRPEPEAAAEMEPEVVAEAEPAIAAEAESVTAAEAEPDEFASFVPPVAPDITEPWEVPQEIEPWEDPQEFAPWDADDKA